MALKLDSKNFTFNFSFLFYSMVEAKRERENLKSAFGVSFYSIFTFFVFETKIKIRKKEMIGLSESFH